MDFRFYPVGGLANQLRGVACAHGWSKALRVPLVVYFNPDEHQVVQALRTPAHWEACFDLSALPYKVERLPSGCVLFDLRFWGWDDKGVLKPVPNLARFIHQDILQVEGLTVRQGIERAIERGWAVSTDAGHWLVGEGLPRLCIREPFVISARVERHVANFLKGTTSKFGPWFRGVHLRYAQPGFAESSPYEIFVERLRNEPGPFFLTADVAEVRTKFLKEFNRSDVFYNPWPKLDQRDADDTWMALTDLMTLSRATRIFGASCSSFDEIASWWGGAPLEKVTNHSRKHWGTKK